MEYSTKTLGISNKQFEYAVSLIGKCTDDYMFYYNLSRDYYSISEEAVDKFDLPDCNFSNASEVLKGIVYEADKEKFFEDFEKLRSGEKQTHDLEYRWRDRNGDIVWISCRGMVANLSEGDDELILVGRVSEIGENKRADNITGLKMENRMDADFLETIIDGNPHKGCMLMIGIDNFKQLNDIYGTKDGDHVLKQLADCIAKVKDKDTYLYRINGDGFLLVDYDNGDIMKSKNLYNDIRIKIAELCGQLEYKAIYTISAGIVEFNEKSSMHGTKKKAEFSLRQAKRNGKNCSFIYDEDTYNGYIRKLDIQEKLRESANSNYLGYQVFYQPIINPETDEVCGAEALLRWKCDEYQNVYPSDFIPILEESGLIIPVGRWVFKTAIKQCKEWQEKIPGFKMHINLSYIQIKRSNVVSEIIQYIDEVQIDPSTIVFEFTESYHIESDDTVKKMISTFKECGIEMAIDDFGTGYSNLTYLQEMDVNTLKIDRSFVVKALSTDFDFKLIRHVVNMAHNVDLSVCLEGIETVNEKERLAELHPEYIQGFLYGRPVDRETFIEQFIK